MKKKSAKLHPVIEAFCREPGLFRIAKEDAKGDLLRALWYQCQISGKGDPAFFEKAFSLYESASARAKDADPNLYILFLASWADLACKKKRLTETMAILNRAKALLSSETPGALRASILNVEGVLASCQSNHQLREKCIRESLDVLPPGCPRPTLWDFNLAVLLAQQGRASEMDLNIFKNHRIRYLTPQAFQYVRFIDCVEREDLEEALTFTGDLKTASQLEAHQILILNNERLVYELMRNWHSSNLRHNETFLAAGNPPPIQVSCALLSKQAERALSLARMAGGQTIDAFPSLGFFSFDLIRAELANRNEGAARRLLDLRRKAGNFSYLDPFFMARVELLAGNKEAASRHFTEALQAIDRYRAQERLAFELELACELKAGDILYLTRNSGFPQKESTSLTLTKKRLAAPLEVISSDSDYGLNHCIGTSPAMQTIRDAIRQFAPLDISVLITGETGTGKEMVARAIHESGPRKDGPFLAINCGAIAESLLESELFGHVRGAFTGAEKSRQGLFLEAGNGTVFLDEIGDMTSRIQVALLRTIELGEVRPVGSNQTHKIACRIIAATNADLEKCLNEGRFRKDLFFRLRRLEIHVPPLRERTEDTLAVADHFLALERLKGTRASLSPNLKSVLCCYPWPGNVRELRNEIERMRLMNSDKLFYDVDDLDARFKSFLPKDLKTMAVSDSLPSEFPAAQTKPIPSENIPPAQKESAPADLFSDEIIIDLLRRGRSSIRRRERLRRLFKQHKLLTRVEVIQILQVSPKTASTDLQVLCREGWIKKMEPSKAARTHYFVLKETPFAEKCG